MSDDLLQALMTAAGYVATNEDDTLLDRVHDLRVQSDVLVQLLTAHPELKAEATVLIQKAARGE